jgi:AcrR family transcriptional regulator
MAVPSMDQKKNRIANIAIKVFLEKGYKSSSLQDIATKIGISKAGLYHYFKSKEEILWYVINRLTGSFIEELRDCAKRCEEEDLEPEAALRTYITTYAYQLNKSREVPLLILRERHQLTGEYRKELYKREREIFQGIREQLGKVPDIKKKYNLNVITFQIISMSHWIGYWFNRKGNLSLESVIQQSIDSIFRGIFK